LFEEFLFAVCTVHMDMTFLENYKYTPDEPTFYVKTISFSHCDNISTTVVDKIEFGSDMYLNVVVHRLLVYQAWKHKSCDLSSLLPVRIYSFCC
jgi:hypothetical protein